MPIVDPKLWTRSTARKHLYLNAMIRQARLDSDSEWTVIGNGKSQRFHHRLVTERRWRQPFPEVSLAPMTCVTGQRELWIPEELITELDNLEGRVTRISWPRGRTQVHHHSIPDDEVRPPVSSVRT